MKFKNHFFIPAIALLFTSCAGDSSDSEKTASDSVVQDPPKEILVDPNEIGEDVSLPSSMRIAGIFKRSGLKFIETNLNLLDNLKNYKTTYTKALNLGVYSADMAYCVLNKQYALSKNYLKSCKDIGSEIGLGSAFEANNLAKRFEDNMNKGKDDSLLTIISDLQLETDIILERSSQQHISTIIFAGAWVETLFTASQVYKGGEKGILPTLMEQVSLVTDILKVAEKERSKDESMNALIINLNAIKGEFDNISAIKDKDLDEVDYTKTEFNQDEINKLCDKITEVRAAIVKG
jgi:hypothetical protein